MRIALVTQNEAVFLPDVLDYLIRRLPDDVDLVACIILRGSSVQGKSSLKKLLNLTHTFGLYFVLRNGIVHVCRVLMGYTVKGLMDNHGIPVLELSKGINDSDSIAKIDCLDLDVLVNVAGSEIFRRVLLDLPRICTLNLHTSKLPHYRGMLPSFWVMFNDEEETAVSVFAVDEGIDTGPIIAQLPIKIGGLSQARLIQLTKLMGMDAIVQAIQAVRDGNVCEHIQKEGEGSYYSLPTREDVREFKRKGKRFF